MKNNKLLIDNKYLNYLKKEKKRGKKIVLCHGAFDLVHPGHLNYLKVAKNFGNILIVTITADKYIKKNTNSPYFDQKTRKDFLKNLRIVDNVFIVNDFTAIPAIKKIKPNYYCKGLEYKKRDTIGNLNKEILVLKENKGKIKYVGKDIQSSTHLLNKFFRKPNFKNYLNSLKYLKKNKFIEDKKAKSKTFFFKGKDETLFSKKIIQCLDNIFQYTKKNVRINFHKRPDYNDLHLMFILQKKNTINPTKKIKKDIVLSVVKGKLELSFYSKNKQRIKKVILNSKDSNSTIIPKNKFFCISIKENYSIYSETITGSFKSRQPVILK